MEDRVALDVELERALAVAAELAAARGDGLTTLHVLRSLVACESARAAIAAAGASIDAVGSAIDQRLDAGGVDVEADVRAFEVALQRATRRVLSTREPTLATIDVLVAIAEEPGCAGRALLAEHQVTPLALRVHASHGDEREEPPRPRGFAARLWARLRPRTPVRSGVSIRLHDDAFTTKEFVVQMLAEHFDLPPDLAIALMEHVHYHGVATIAVLPLEEAHRRIEAVTAQARERGFPLRLTSDIELARAVVHRHRDPA